MKIFKALRKSLAIFIGLFVLLTSMTVRAEEVSVKVGEALSYPNGFSYMTHYFYINDTLAYCLQPRLGPTSNGNMDATEIYSDGDNGYPLLIKVLACGYGGPNDITSQYFPGATDRERYVYTHIAAGYAYMSNSEMNSTINDITGLSNEQFEACGLGNFVRAAWETEYKGTVKLVKINGYQDIGYLASYSLPEKTIKIDLIKTDMENIGLKGAEYGIYRDEACLDLISKMNTTDELGKTFIELKSSNENVYIKEIVAPKGYCLDRNVYTVSLADNQVLELKDKEVQGKVSLKKDSDAGDKFKGDSTLNGAEYSIYAAEEVKNLTTGQKYYEKDAFIGQIITNSEGIGSLNGLKVGKYYMKETSAPRGYELNDNTLFFEIDDENGVNEVVERSVNDTDKLIVGDIQINKMKLGDENVKVEGAGFSIYLKSQLETENGKYIFDEGKAITLNDEGDKVVYTNDEGVIRIENVPYGTYIIHESVVPKNYLQAEDVEVGVGLENVSGITKSLNIYDDYYKVKLRINKIDATNNNIIKNHGEGECSFDIYDSKTDQIIEHDVKLNAEGMAYTSKYLEAGEYKIVEISSPNGYKISADSIAITVDDSNVSIYDDMLNEDVMEINYYNIPVNGKLTISKSGEKLVNIVPGDEEKRENAVFVYENRPLDGVKYEIYAKNDVFFPDGRTDEAGNKLKIYDKDEIIAEIETDINGNAFYSDSLRPLYEGNYYIKEVASKEGYLLDDTKYDFTINSDNESVQFNLINERQMFDIEINKYSSEDKSYLKGALFSIYADFDVFNCDGNLIAKKGDYLGTTNEDLDGISKFNLDLTKGKYLLKEIVSPSGYYIDEDMHSVDLDYEKNVDKVVKNVDIFNDKKPVINIFQNIKKDSVVKGASLVKTSLNNYRTDDNGIDGYSILLDYSNSKSNKKYLGAAVLLLIIVGILVSSFVRKKIGRDSNDKK